MSRTGKFLIKLILLLFVVAVIGIGAIAAAVHPFMDNHHYGISGFGPGNWQFADRYDGGWEHRGPFLGGLFGLLIHLAALVAGWKFWKRGRRLLGGLLLAFALLPLLAVVFGMLIHLLIPAALLFLAWRFIRKRRCSHRRWEPEFAGAEPAGLDYLDEWEIKTRRQQRNQPKEEN